VVVAVVLLVVLVVLLLVVLVAVLLPQVLPLRQTRPPVVAVVGNHPEAPAVLAALVVQELCTFVAVFKAMPSLLLLDMVLQPELLPHHQLYREGSIIIF
jgi:hypothetical protein